ncbi:peptidase [Candidatus Gottesmanbacteria bacterium RBG_13_45_10]|uniref:Peptidase n=1 Tax=Candidatus Gottesmanbacteria bacterium RBG_13_45_10 TaxID=1798370 RepID=A0A1F5ZHM4_9BACT|nr:MAG: peptidase [Candidatus Gottesmanbacteria bacterium RBG_13_45_10]
MSIAVMKKKSYPGSNLIIEQTLSPGSNYQQYIASYLSDGLKIYGLLTVPTGENPPAGGWPVIIFNHGYIPPEQYRTTERYVAYVDAFARAGYIVFKPDYRGNGSSEGQPEGAYYSPAYATDVLNALATLKRYKDANPEKIGMWGHSLGGNITLRDIVVDTTDIKAAVIWGGVVGSYDDLMNNWQRRVRYQPPPKELALRNNYRQRLVDTYGTPTTNPQFWNSIDPTNYLSGITTPIQLHTGANDEEVPVAFSVSLKEKLEKLGKAVEYYTYPGGDHNISSPNFESAMQRSIVFFNKYLKS